MPEAAIETPVQEPIKNKKNGLVFKVLGVVIGVLIASGLFANAYLLIKEKEEPKPVPTAIPTLSPTPTPTPTPTPDPTADWKTYRNEEYGYKIKYPPNWKIDFKENKLFVCASKWREGLPEGEMCLQIESKEKLTDLDSFIKEYQSRDPTGHGQITKQEMYLLDKIEATKLTATTALGIDVNIIFAVKDECAYIIIFHDFDEDHEQILSTFRFLE